MSAKERLNWVIENIQQNGLTWRGLLASDILLLNEEDFCLFFPERQIQKIREEKLKKLGI